MACKTGGSNAPQIHSFGPTVRTHRRHFLQQAEYTICMSYQANEWRFAPHQEVIQASDGHQDVLWKINIPSTERLKVLQLLDDYNLNAYSLFQSEESLMETIAVREIDFSDRFSG
jgi:hypothetical protein